MLEAVFSVTVVTVCAILRKTGRHFIVNSVHMISAQLVAGLIL